MLLQKLSGINPLMVCRMWIQRFCEFQSIAKGSNSFILYFSYCLVTLSLLDNSVALKSLNKSIFLWVIS